MGKQTRGGVPLFLSATACPLQCSVDVDATCELVIVVVRGFHREVRFIADDSDALGKNVDGTVDLRAARVQRLLEQRSKLLGGVRFGEVQRKRLAQIVEVGSRVELRNVRVEHHLKDAEKEWRVPAHRVVRTTTERNKLAINCTLFVTHNISHFGSKNKRSFFTIESTIFVFVFFFFFFCFCLFVVFDFKIEFKN